MWEFCVRFSNQKKDMKLYLENKIGAFISECDGIITSQEISGEFSITIACNECEKYRLILVLENLISDAICYFYKKDFLDKNMRIIKGDKMTQDAFLTALLYFDKETDKYIVNKYLNIEEMLNIDGFYFFKLNSLRKKWDELIDIANDNDVYLYSNETFLELIKFLVDNIEIKKDVVNLVPTDKECEIFDSKFEEIKDLNKVGNDEHSTISYLIELSPKNINIYSAEKLPYNLKTLICRLFEKRVRFVNNM